MKTREHAMNDAIQEIIEKTGKIVRVHRERFSHEESFIDLSARFSHLPGTVLLLSGGGQDCARYHILAAHPYITCSGRGRTITITTGEKSLTFEGDPFKTIKALIRAYALPDPLPPPELPVMAGLFGYLSYDLKDAIETLPKTAVDDLRLPHFYLTAPAILLVHDRQNGTTTLCLPEGPAGAIQGVKETLYAIQNRIQEPRCNGTTGERLHSNFTQETYMAAVETIRDYIASGHVYQVNMSQRFQIGFEGDPFSLFTDLFKKNPAPFFAFINAQDHAILSTSPERFLCQKGSLVESRPIKGTRPRGKTQEQDDDLKRDLQESTKDDAELSMIVDLIRNDMGKVCAPETVRVSAHKRLEPYENVWHMVSIVEGVLEAPLDAVDLIQATFPGGSITGCPKIRSMEIIDELESVRRHIYTGSIGYISFHKTMDLSIAIRTATLYQGSLYFSVGGGVVYDSDPLSEFKETLHKGETLMKTILGRNRAVLNPSYVWHNGRLLPTEKACAPISDLGFQYGFGFFETLRVVYGQIRFLDDHIRRFNQTWEKLYGTLPPDLSWDAIIERVLEKNRLMDQVAAVKIVSTSGSGVRDSFDGQLIVSARAYRHRLEETGQKGIRLISAPFPRESWLSNHKTLNYLEYYLAGRHAKEFHGDEALLLNPDQSISETNTANILILSGNTLIVPETRHKLPGIMEKKIIALLTAWGFQTAKKKVFKTDLFQAEGVLVSNSLMGAAPVLSLDQIPLGRSSGIIDQINQALL